ncbi:MAG: hypothetical protein WCF05_08190, partial [Chromatiaceae bacterium]
MSDSPYRIITTLKANHQRQADVADKGAGDIVDELHPGARDHRQQHQPDQQQDHLLAIEVAPDVRVLAADGSSTPGTPSQRCLTDGQTDHGTAQRRVQLGPRQIEIRLGPGHLALGGRQIGPHDVNPGLGVHVLLTGSKMRLLWISVFL